MWYTHTAQRWTWEFINIFIGLLPRVPPSLGPPRYIRIYLGFPLLIFQHKSWALLCFGLPTSAPAAKQWGDREKNKQWGHVPSSWGHSCLSWRARLASSRVSGACGSSLSLPGGTARGLGMREQRRGRKENTEGFSQRRLSVSGSLPCKLSQN